MNIISQFTKFILDVAKVIMNALIVALSVVLYTM